MKSSCLRHSLFLALACFSQILIPRASALTLTLNELGGLTASLDGVGGTVTITPTAVDHWKVRVHDSRVGGPIGIPDRLAFTEPEPSHNLTAYNNVQLLQIVPGGFEIDVLSDEFSPYATVLPNFATAPLIQTSLDTIYIHFIDHADHNAPEAGTTAGILGVAFLSLIGAGRRNFAR